MKLVADTFIKSNSKTRTTPFPTPYTTD